MATRATLHRLVDVLPNADLATAARVLAALVAARAESPVTAAPGEYADAATGVRALVILSIPETCRRLGGISRDTFDRDRALRALVQPVTRGRIGVREDALDALIERRTAAARPPAPLLVPPPTGRRPYQRRHTHGV